MMPLLPHIWCLKKRSLEGPLKKSTIGGSDSDWKMSGLFYSFQKTLIILWKRSWYSSSNSPFRKIYFVSFKFCGPDDSWKKWGGPLKIFKFDASVGQFKIGGGSVGFSNSFTFSSLRLPWKYSSFVALILISKILV